MGDLATEAGAPTRRTVVDNVRDGRRSYTGSWVTEPLVYAELHARDIGRTVIYRDHGRAEAGTLTSWRDGNVWARYSRGDTASAASADRLVFGIRALDTPEEIIGARR